MLRSNAGLDLIGRKAIAGHNSFNPKLLRGCDFPNGVNNPVQAALIKNGRLNEEERSPASGNLSRQVSGHGPMNNPVEAAELVRISKDAAGNCGAIKRAVRIQGLRGHFLGNSAAHQRVRVLEATRAAIAIIDREAHGAQNMTDN